jgi:hypothetical protein
MNDSEIQVKAIAVLQQSLGMTNTLRFLGLLSHGKTDYVEVSKKIYGNQSIDEIFIRAKKLWDSQAET